MDKKKASLEGLNLNGLTSVERFQKQFPVLTEKQKKGLVKSNFKLRNVKDKKLKNINISNIIEFDTFCRYDESDTYDDLQSIKNPEAIEVATVKGIKGYYFLVDGGRRYRYQESKGRSKIKAVIVGEAICQSRISMARAIVMTNFKEPLSTMEKTIGLVRLRRTLFNELGKDAFSSHGGNRKECKINIYKYLSEITGLEYCVVQTLVNFGRKVGTLALEYLDRDSEYNNLQRNKQWRGQLPKTR